MADYYSILGLSKTATEIEIKGAFRRLAKIYHPDKNPNDPNSKTIFENIVNAYNVLINPHQRRRYDQSLYVTPKEYNKPPQSRSHKKWDVTEEQKKQRQYYKDYYNAKKQTAKQPIEQPKYSDYKYILFATPIAVGLLMFILFIFGNEPNATVINTATNLTTEEVILSVENSLENGETPYSGYFGGIKTYETNLNLQMNNISQFDAVIVLFSKKDDSYLQHSYLKPNFTVSFSFLPEEGVYWKCLFGKNWNKDLLVFNKNVVGCFDSIVQYQNWKNYSNKKLSSIQDEVNFISIISINSEFKSLICDETSFFKK